MAVAVRHADGTVSAPASLAEFGPSASEGCRYWSWLRDTESCSLYAALHPPGASPSWATSDFLLGFPGWVSGHTGQTLLSVGPHHVRANEAFTLVVHGYGLPEAAKELVAVAQRIKLVRADPESGRLICEKPPASEVL